MASRFGPSNDWRRTSGQLNENRTYFNTRFNVYGALMNKGVHLAIPRYVFHTLSVVNAGEGIDGAL
jgi:hypothetical protein